jgi:hypothetical protein
VNAVQRILAVAAATLLLALQCPVAGAQSGQDDLRSQFDAIIAGLNDNTFKPFHAAIDNNDFLNRIVGTRVVAPDARQFMASDFDSKIEASFIDAFPRPRGDAEASGEIIGTLVSFEESGGRARALVRFEGQGFRFSYHAYDVSRGRGGRVQIIDWFDFYNGAWFSEIIGDSLVKLMPTPQAVASVLELPNASGGQLFQVGELLKSARDRNPQRYFEILDNMDEVLRDDPFIVALNFQWCRMLRDPGRLQAAAGDLARVFPGEARFSLSLGEYYVQRGRFEQAIEQFDALEEALGIKDGVIESLKATAAMALGEFERAETYAASATRVEPGLELGWWSLLRTRTAAQDYEGAIEPLTALEERFGHLLIPQKLRRDRFLKVLIDQPAYQEWRAARDAG